MINSNMYSQRGRWERGRSPVGCVFQRTVKIKLELLSNICGERKSLSAKRFFMPILFNGALKTAPYELCYDK